jgi:hypothetical protein
LYYNGLEKLATTSTGIDVTGTATMDNAEIGTGGASDANAILDLTGDTTYTDFGFRVIRKSGANAGTDLRHRGTGDLKIEAVEAAAISFETSDTERMRIDSSGQVGIGTSSPSKQLEVQNAAAGTAIRASNNGGGYAELACTSNATSTAELNFTNSLAMLGGNVSIGTSTTSAPLRVNVGTDQNCAINTSGGNPRITAFNDAANVSIPLAFNGSILKFEVGGTERMRINSSGSVGIGQTDPKGPLHVYGSEYVYMGPNVAGVTPHSTTQGIALGWNKSGGQGESIIAHNRGAGSHGGLVFANNNGGTYREDMRIDPSGNVGIGTDSPATLIEASGSSTSTTTGISSPLGLTLRNTDTTDDNYTTIQNRDGNGDQNAEIKFINASHASNTGAIAFTTRSATGEFAEKLRISPTGNVGIGEPDPSDKLVVRSSDINSVQSALSLKNGDTGASAGVALNFVVDDANDVVTAAIYGQRTASAYHQGSLQFLTRNSGGTLTEQMRIDSSGRVGIGTSAPEYKLNVAGDIVADGDANARAIGFNFYGALKYNLYMDGSTDADKMHIRKGTTNVATFDSSGDVGINTSSPSEKLQVDGNIRLGDTATGTNDDEEYSITSGGQLIISANDSAADISYSGLILNAGKAGGAAASSSLVMIQTNDVERMRIDASGNVSVANGVIGRNTADSFTLNGKSQPQYGFNLDPSTGVPVGVSGYFGVAFATSSAERMRIDSSGRVGIGTSSPIATLSIKGSVNELDIETTTAGATIESIDRTDLTAQSDLSYYARHGEHKFFGASYTERMRIDSSGRTLFGNTDNLGSKPAGVICPMGYVGRAGTSGSSANVFNIHWTGNAAQLYIDTSNIGSISTSSDYRIKKNINPMESGAISRVLDLKPITYELTDYKELFKSDGVVREGFIAHEVQEVIPSGADGTKDEEDCIQSLRVDAIVAVLTKAVQEQQTLIESLTTRIAALETGE